MVAKQKPITTKLRTLVNNEGTPANIYLSKSNKRNTRKRMSNMFKLTIKKPPERPSKKEIFANIFNS